MTRNIFAALGVVAAGAAAGAQTPSPSQPGSTSQKNDQNTITVSGCLKPWTGGSGSSASSSGSSSTAASDAGRSGGGASYVLTNVQRKDSMSGTSPRGEAGSATGGTATSGSSTSGSSDAHDQYLLQAGGSVDLSKHVNHQIEVTGKMSDKNMSSSGARGTTGSTGTGSTGSTGSTGATGTGTSGTGTGATGTTSRPGMTGQDGHKTAPATLAVSSVKMISATCQ